jgi:hypothetical protein
MQGVEIGDAIDAEDDGLAVDGEMLMAIFQLCIDDPRIAVGLVVAAARDQAHAVAVALDADAVAVVFVRKSSRLWPLRADVIGAVSDRSIVIGQQRTCPNRRQWVREQALASSLVLLSTELHG